MTAATQDTAGPDTAGPDTAGPDTAGIVRRVVADELRANQVAASAPLDQVTDDLVLGSGGLGISSLLLLHIFVKLEASLGFTFEDAAVAGARFVTVGDLVRFVTGAAPAPHRAGET
jgi:acyl carrier protein